MQKNVVIVGVVFAFLLLAGAGAAFLNMSKTPSYSPTRSVPTTMQPSSATNQPVMQSMKEILLGGLSLQCTFTDQQGRHMQSFIKGGKIRTDITSSNPQESGSVIMKNKTMFFWHGNEGIKMEFSQDFTSMTDDTIKTSTNQQQKDVIENLEKYKDSCKQASVSDALFVEPSTIKFTDLSSMMKASGGSVIPTIDQQRTQQMMKQYAPKASGY